MFKPLTHLKPFAALCAAVIIAAALAFPAQARPTRGHATTVAVIGDSVANDLGRGLQDLLGNKGHVRIVKQTRFATGLVRTDYYDWNAVAHQFLRHHRPDIVAGGDRRQRPSGAPRARSPLRSVQQGLGRRIRHRVARFMRHFKRRHAQVYWVSLPPVRSHTLTRAYRVINRIYRREAKRHGFHYLSVWDRFTTRRRLFVLRRKPGRRASRQLRKKDGEHFTGGRPRWCSPPMSPRPSACAD